MGARINEGIQKKKLFFDLAIPAGWENSESDNEYWIYWASEKLFYQGGPTSQMKNVFWNETITKVSRFI